MKRCSKRQYPVFSKDKVMARTSSIDMQLSVTEEKMCKYDVQPKDTVNLSCSCQRQPQQINEQDSFIDVKSSIGNSEDVQKHDYNVQSRLTKPTLADSDDQDSPKSPAPYFSLDESFDVIPRGDFSKTVPVKGDVYGENPILPSVGKSEVQLISENTESNISTSSIFEEIEHNEFCQPLLGWGESSSDAECSPILSEKITIPSEQRNNGNFFSKELMVKHILKIMTQKALENKLSPIMSPAWKCMKSKDEEKDPVCSENAIVSSTRENNDNSFSEECELCTFNSPYMCEKEAEPTGLFQSPFMCVKSKDTVKDASKFSSDIGDVKDLSNKNGILNTTEFLFKHAPSKTDDPRIATKNEKDASFPLKRPFSLETPEMPQNDHITDTSDTKCKTDVFRFSAMPSCSLPKTNPAELPKPSDSKDTSDTKCKTDVFHFSAMPSCSLPKTNPAELLRPSDSKVGKPISIDKNYNKSSTELILNLINWKKMGLDKAFNMPIEDDGADFGNDLKCGLDLMEELRTHVSFLLLAAKTLPNLHLEICDSFDILHRGMTVWMTINELQLSAIQTINDMTTDPDCVINLFNKMTYKLSVLSEEMEDFRNMIRVYCSEIEKLL